MSWSLPRDFSPSCGEVAALEVGGAGLDLYAAKQREVLAARASLVEIDLTRSGRRSVVPPLSHVPEADRATYVACVRRGRAPLELEVYALSLRQRLPAIAMPLREGDDDVPLELQTLVDQCYRNGRYEDTDYRCDPEPPFGPDDAAWVADLLQGAGRR